ncbi:MAG: hypothetical protein ACRDTT_22220, partial [Pseudonocardiaceae bacterium]
SAARFATPGAGLGGAPSWRGRSWQNTERVRYRAICGARLLATSPAARERGRCLMCAAARVSR